VLLVILCCLAEDCIRYRNVTGVQTCALPISFDDLLDGHNGFGNDWGFGSNILWLLWFSNLFHDLFLAAFDLLNRNNFLNQFFSISDDRLVWNNGCTRMYRPSKIKLSYHVTYI